MSVCCNGLCIRSVGDQLTRRVAVALPLKANARWEGRERLKQRKSGRRERRRRRRRKEKEKKNGAVLSFFPLAEKKYKKKNKTLARLLVESRRRRGDSTLLKARLLPSLWAGISLFLSLSLHSVCSIPIVKRDATYKKWRV